MLEVEGKFRGADWADVQRRLALWGAVLTEIRHDADHYFSAPDRDYSETDEAVRLRRIGEQNYFTYKGPKRDKETKTRPEVELPLGNGDENAAKAISFMSYLGYRPIAVVNKKRQLYRFFRDGFSFEACLDEVESVGQYVELEVKAEESNYVEAKNSLLAAAEALGLNDQERRSYLELLLLGREG